MPGFSYDGARWTCRIDLVEDVLTVTERMPQAGEASLAVQPPPGGTVTIEFSCSSTVDLAADDGLFVLAAGLGDAGIVSESTIDNVPSTVTAVRVTASAPGARVEIAQ